MQSQSFPSKFKSDHCKQNFKQNSMCFLCLFKKVSYSNPQFQHDTTATFSFLPHSLDSSFGLLMLTSSVRMNSSRWYLGFLANSKLLQQKFPFTAQFKPSYLLWKISLSSYLHTTSCLHDIHANSHYRWNWFSLEKKSFVYL